MQNPVRNGMGHADIASNLSNIHAPEDIGATGLFQKQLLDHGLFFVSF